MKRSIIMACLLSLSLTFSGCGETEESKALEAYREQMDAVFTNITDIHATMNAIDADSETATTQLLDCFDSLQTELNTMAEITVPDQFAGIEDLADEAAENMVQANALFHESFGNGSYNEYKAEAANEYYARVNKRLQIILQLFHGETPDLEGVTVTMESPDSVLSSGGETSDTEASE